MFSLKFFYDVIYFSGKIYRGDLTMAIADCNMKIETHCHTKTVSPCGHVEPHTVVDEYIKAGYGAIIITDHFSRNILARFEGNYTDKIDCYLAGYKYCKAHAKKLAKEGHPSLKVMLGAEILLDTNPSDILLFGLSEEFFYENPNLFDLDQEGLYRLLHTKYDAVMYQAHPFRKYCNRQDPRYLDGVEVYNGNIRHDNHSDVALTWAKENNLKFSSGSDFHQMMDLAKGGLVIPDSIEDVHQFKDFITNNEPLYLVDSEIQAKGSLIV